MLRNVARLARCYCDLLGFWSACSDKQCRRARRCRDHSGQCWNARYPRTDPLRERLRSLLRSRRRALPQALKDYRRRHDPADGLL